MHDIINNIGTWSILKWAVIVLVAGFIGQFGKSMAQAVMAKVRLARAKKQGVNNNGLPKAPMPEAEPPVQAVNSSHAPSPVTIGTPDKKTLKTFAKQDKKAAKLVKKGS
jgi:hypothetical protein